VRCGGEKRCPFSLSSREGEGSVTKENLDAATEHAGFDGKIKREREDLFS